MKKSFLLAALFVAGLATSCINDADVPANSPDKPVVNGDGNVAFRFVVPNTSVDGRNGETAENSGVEEAGFDDEYKVDKVRLYLFTEATGNFHSSIEVTDLGTPSTAGNDVTYAEKSFTLNPGTYRVFAIANADVTIANPSTVDNLLAEIDKKTYAEGLISECPSGGIIMTNRGAQSQVFTITPNNHSKVSILLERVLAKVSLAKSQNTYELMDNQNSVYVRITPSVYTLVNLNKEYYLFRHVGTFAEADGTPVAPARWDLTTNFGAIPETNGYAIDPHFFEKTVAAAEGFDGSTMFANPLAGGSKLSFTGTFPAVDSGASSYMYCLENTMFRPAQLNGYTTGVIIKANITIPEEHCFREDGSTVDPENQPATLYYFNHDFYTSLEAVKTIGKANTPSSTNPTDAELAEFNIKRFVTEQGSKNCYYHYWIKHLDNGHQTVMGVMEYGIVRNNIYKVTVTNVLGLGEGKPNDDPTLPDEKKGYLDVDFSVKPWIVRAQDAELEN